MPVAGESGATCRSSAVATVRYALRGPSLAPRGIKWRSLPGLDGRCVARCWYPQLPNRCRTGWSRKASYLLARDQPVTPPTQASMHQPFSTTYSDTDLVPRTRSDKPSVTLPGRRWSAPWRPPLQWQRSGQVCRRRRRIYLRSSRRCP